jgi:predicted nucleic acid-binding protein
MAVIDASVWVSYINEKDKFHDKASDIFNSINSTKEEISIPALALTEVAGVIKRITQDQEAAFDAVRFVESMKPDILADFSELEPIATQIAVNYSTRGADAYYLAVAVVTRSHLYTFDQQQGNAFEEMNKTR